MIDLAAISATTPALLALGALALGISLPRLRGKKERLALWAAWLVPGLGHLIIGDRLRGALFFVLINATFAYGAWITAGGAFDWEWHEYLAALQVFHGAGAALCWQLADPAHTLLHPTREYELGMVYTIVASLLNVLVLMNLANLGSPKAQSDQ